jgi:pyruvate formate lyase activating enzyme
MHQAILFDQLEGNQVRCRLCAHGCLIKDGKRGICQVRQNQGGVLYSLVYGRPIAANPDPIEKKPLFHFLPGTSSFSIATLGCNFQCAFCQNWNISQHPRLYDAQPDQEPEVPADAIVRQARASGCASISYTYTEPTIYFEYARDCMALAVEQGLKNAFVTNGFESADCVEACRGLLHAANVDLKAMTDHFYKEECKGRLQPVLDTLGRLYAAGIWLEVTTLLIPGKNDDPGELRELAGFIKNELSPLVPWHVSAYTPRFKYETSGIGPTPPKAVEAALNIGREAGLAYVYAGNLPPGHDAENTLCHQCGARLITRRGFRVTENRLNQGNCPECGASQAGVWS